MDLKLLIQDYLMKAQLMQVASCHDHQPWIASVYFAIDINLNLYWLSREDTRHSQEIIHNSKVAGTVVFPHNYGEKVRGIQFEGTARQLKDEEAAQGLAIYKSRYWIVENRVKENDGQDPHTCFQLKPNSYLLFDEINFPENPRQELKL